MSVQIVLDVTDDFNSEKKVIDEIQKMWDPSYNFSYDDYLFLVLIGVFLILTNSLDDLKLVNLISSIHS